jgi:hypothetical protein
MLNVTNVRYAISVGYSSGGTPDDVPDIEEQPVGTEREPPSFVDQWLHTGTQRQEEVGGSQLGGAPLATQLSQPVDTTPAPQAAQGRPVRDVGPPDPLTYPRDQTMAAQRAARGRKTKLPVAKRGRI